jgi:hypothetical protein
VALECCRATGPRIVELFTPKASDLRLNIRQIYSQNLALAAWNKGHMNSQLQSARITARTKDRKQIEGIPLQIVGGQTVPRGQQALFGLTIPLAVIPTFLSWPHSQIQSATLVVFVNEYKKQPETRNLDVPLEDFRLFCLATEDADTQYRRPASQPVDSRLKSVCVRHPN